MERGAATKRAAEGVPVVTIASAEMPNAGVQRISHNLSAQYLEAGESR